MHEGIWRHLRAEIGLRAEIAGAPAMRRHDCLLDWIDREEHRRVLKKRHTALARRFAGDRRIIFPPFFSVVAGSDEAEPQPFSWSSRKSSATEFMQ